METNEPNVYPTILGVVSRGFWSPFLDVGARSAIFWHLKTGTFNKSACFQVPKSGTWSAQIFERTPKTSRNTPQNGGVDIWFIRFHFWASSKPIFENYLFYVCQELFSHYHGPQTSSGLPSGIYGSINLKIVFWALLTTLNMPCDGRKKIPKFYFFGPG